MLRQSLLLITLFTSPIHAEVLSEKDRAVLLRTLETVLESSAGELTKKQDSASSAFQKGIQSDAAALSLYLQCVELTQFKQRGLRDIDFREWKRRNDDRLNDAAFKRALRHQLNWLVLSIEASTADTGDKDDRERIQIEAIKRLSELYQDAENLVSKNDRVNRAVQGELARDVLQSAFAQAYGFHTLSISGWSAGDTNINISLSDPANKKSSTKNDPNKAAWPSHPKDLAGIYQKIVFPLYREEKDTASLRKAWDQMVLFHEISLQNWEREAKYSERTTKSLPTPALVTFQRDVKPQILWKKEVDLFSSGDQKQASTNMVEFIQTNMQNSLSSNWTSELIGLLQTEEN